MTEPLPWQVIELGTCGYREAWSRQLELVEERKAERGVDTLLLVEHPHVITLGRSQRAAANVLAADGVEVVEVERGGDVTYHGPGQLVAYPVLLLRDGERDLHHFLRKLEEAVIRTCVALGLPADREPGKTGVWTSGLPGASEVSSVVSSAVSSAVSELEPPERSSAPASEPAGPARRKLCSMGIACRRWVTFHGLALNVNTDLSYFGRINPCGFRSEVMTSLTRELGREVSMAEVKRQLVAELGTQLGRTAD